MAPMRENITHWVVDLDGTLIKTDVLKIASKIALLRRPWVLILAALAWVVERDRQAFKRTVSRFIRVPPQSLPYVQEVLTFISQEKSKGKKVYLVSASVDAWVRPIGEYVGGFDGIQGSGRENLRSMAKVEWMKTHLVASGLASLDRIGYLGDSLADIPIWRSLGSAWLCGASTRVTRCVTRLGIPVTTVWERDHHR